MRVQRPLRRVAMVVFDCDSTLSAIEGIDELADAQRAAIEELTAAAMRGDVPLEAVYGRRLALIRPTRERVEALAAQYIARLVPDAAAVVAALHSEGIEVRILSGGLRPAVLAVARALNVDARHVAAVDVMFDEGGAYRAFDERSPLARNHGKHEIVAQWRTEVTGAVMMVGDGVTDLEASEAADVFVAYAGVVAREAVVAAADVVITSPSLAPVVPLALGGDEPRGDAARRMVDKGLALLTREDRSRLLKHV
jgi:phosphoserine phosphatase